MTGSDTSRLYFLLEGNARLKVDNGSDYLLGNGEFTLLPPGCLIMCSALACSGYVIISCNCIKIVSYLEELKKDAGKENDSVPSVAYSCPFHEGSY